MTLVLCARCSYPMLSGVLPVGAACDASGTVIWCSRACADADGFPTPDLRAIRARTLPLQQKAPVMPRIPAVATPPASRHLRVTITIPLPEDVFAQAEMVDVFAQAEMVAQSAAPIRALKEAIGEHAIETVKPPRKARTPRLVAASPTAASNEGI